MLNAPGGDDESLPLAGDMVESPENDADSQYLYRKKLLTVNGMHTVIVRHAPQLRREPEELPAAREVPLVAAPVG